MRNALSFDSSTKFGFSSVLNESRKTTVRIPPVYDTKFFISQFVKAFKVMKNGVYFIVISFLFAELFKILVYAS